MTAIASSRFGSCINTIDLELDLDLPGSLLSLGLQEVALQAKPCKDVDFCFSPVFRLLACTFTHTTNLRNLIIRPPSDISNRELSLLSHTRILERLTHGGHGEIEEEELSHGYVPGYHSPRCLYHSIFAAVNTAKVRLERIELLDSSNEVVQIQFAPSISVLRTLAIYPCIQTLCALTLRLDIFQINSLPAAAALEGILKNSANLKQFDLNLRPTFHTFISVAERKITCRLVFKALGVLAPFRLKKLALTGLYAESATTIARTVYVHVNRLRTLILIDSYFDDTNSIPSMFNSLADSQVDLLILKNFHIGGKLVIEYSMKFLQDDDPSWDSEEDHSYKDWIHVSCTNRDGEIVYNAKDMADGTAQFQMCMRCISHQLTEEL